MSDCWTEVVWISFKSHVGENIWDSVIHVLIVELLEPANKNRRTWIKRNAVIAPTETHGETRLLRIASKSQERPTRASYV
jgi:hypothetical protein